MIQTDLLVSKIRHDDYQRLIIQNSVAFSEAEFKLLHEILSGFEFDVIQAQALARAVLQQVRFDPNDYHIDDEDVTGTCPHCINPPMPPLRDYLVWRQTRG